MRSSTRNAAASNKWANYDLQAALGCDEIVCGVNCCTPVYVCVRACLPNNCVMRVFDWWGCCCHSIGHGSSCPLTLSNTLMASRFTLSFLSFSFHQLHLCFLPLHCSHSPTRTASTRWSTSLGWWCATSGTPWWLAQRWAAGHRSTEKHNNLMFCVILSANLMQYLTFFCSVKVHTYQEKGNTMQIIEANMQLICQWVLSLQIK